MSFSLDSCILNYIISSAHADSASRVHEHGSVEASRGGGGFRQLWRHQDTWCWNGWCWGIV